MLFIACVYYPPLKRHLEHLGGKQTLITVSETMQTVSQHYIDRWTSLKSSNPLLTIYLERFKKHLQDYYDKRLSFLMTIHMAGVQ